MSSIVVPAGLALIAYFTAHTAGAGYVIAYRDKRSALWPAFRSIASFALLALAIKLLVR
jgi:hypothetical protein